MRVLTCVALIGGFASAPILFHAPEAASFLGAGLCGLLGLKTARS